MVEAPRLRHLHLPPQSDARMGVAVQEPDTMTDLSIIEQCLLTCDAPESVWRPALNELKSELDQARRDNVGAFDLLSRIRFALGDNGKRMQDELIAYCRELAAREPLKPVPLPECNPETWLGG